MVLASLCAAIKWHSSTAWIQVSITFLARQDQDANCVFQVTLAFEGDAEVRRFLIGNPEQKLRPSVSRTSKNYSAIHQSRCMDFHFQCQYTIYIHILQSTSNKMLLLLIKAELLVAGIFLATLLIALHIRRWVEGARQLPFHFHLSRGFRDASVSLSADSYSATRLPWGVHQLISKFLFQMHVHIALPDSCRKEVNMLRNVKIFLRDEFLQWGFCHNLGWSNLATPCY